MTNRDRELIAGYLSGDPGAYKEIDSWIVSVVKCRAWGGDLAVTDLVQESRLSVYRSLSAGSFEGRSPLKAYVCRIASNICLTWMRQKYRKLPVVGLDDVPDPPCVEDDPLAKIIREENASLKEQVVEAFMDLAVPECRDLWRMVYYEKLSYDDIAGMIGVEVGTVKSRISRCKQKARSALRAIARNLGLEITEILEL
jgi:RNA polymerase sigma-70 factor (ECF subfamily)